VYINLHLKDRLYVEIHSWLRQAYARGSRRIKNPVVLPVLGYRPNIAYVCMGAGTVFIGSGRARSSHTFLFTPLPFLLSFPSFLFSFPSHLRPLEVGQYKLSVRLQC